MSPLSRAERRDTAGRAISRCWAASRDSCRLSSPTDTGRQYCSITSVGSPETAARSCPKCSAHGRSRVSRTTSGSQVTTFISVSLNRECSLRLAEPTVSQ